MNAFNKKPGNILGKGIIFFKYTLINEKNVDLFHIKKDYILLVGTAFLPQTALRLVWG